MPSKIRKSTASYGTGANWTVMLFAAGLLIIASPAMAEAPLDALNGSWAGGGTLTFDDGGSEKLNCNGYYKSAGGQNLSVVIRCKGSATSFELRSKLSVNGDKVTGSWEERTYNATGGASGTSSPGKLQVNFSGSLTGTLSMSYSASGVSVSVSVGTAGAGIKSAQVSLRRQ